MRGTLQFDIYIQRTEGIFNKLFNKRDMLDQERIEEYFKKGVNDLYVKKEDYRKYLFFAEKVAKQILDDPKGSNAKDMAVVISDMINLCMLEVMVNIQIDRKSMETSSDTIIGCVRILEKEPKEMIRVFKLMLRHPYMLRHSISTALFSVLLAEKAQLGSEKSLTLVGMGALLHDLGMSQLAFDAETKEELTALEWKEVKQHSELGKRLLDGVRGVSSEVKAIVLQHHEQENGNGYPNGLRGNQIYAPAKIVAVADAFSALVSKRPFRSRAFEPLDAIKVMREDRGKYDPVLIDLMSDLFVRLKS